VIVLERVRRSETRSAPAALVERNRSTSRKSESQVLPVATDHTLTAVGRVSVSRPHAGDERREIEVARLSSPAMHDLSAPSSYLMLERGVDVFSRDREKTEEVQHVLADPEPDVVVRARVSGRHVGEFAGGWPRGKIVEHWASGDEVSATRPLGAL
jgi:hypothetical protein